MGCACYSRACLPTERSSWQRQATTHCLPMRRDCFLVHLVPRLDTRQRSASLRSIVSSRPRPLPTRPACLTITPVWLPLVETPLGLSMPMDGRTPCEASSSRGHFQAVSRTHQDGPTGVAHHFLPPSSAQLELILLRRAGQPPMPSTVLQWARISLARISSVPAPALPASSRTSYVSSSVSKAKRC